MVAKFAKISAAKRLALVTIHEVDHRGRIVGDDLPGVRNDDLLVVGRESLCFDVVYGGLVVCERGGRDHPILSRDTDDPRTGCTVHDGEHRCRTVSVGIVVGEGAHGTLEHQLHLTDPRDRGLLIRLLVVHVGAASHRLHDLSEVRLAEAPVGSRGDGGDAARVDCATEGLDGAHRMLGVVGHVDDSGDTTERGKLEDRREDLVRRAVLNSTHRVDRHRVASASGLTVRSVECRVLILDDADGTVNDLLLRVLDVGGFARINELLRRGRKVGLGDVEDAGGREIFLRDGQQCLAAELRTSLLDLPERRRVEIHVAKRRGEVALLRDRLIETLAKLVRKLSLDLTVAVDETLVVRIERRLLHLERNASVSRRPCSGVRRHEREVARGEGSRKAGDASEGATAPAHRRLELDVGAAEARGESVKGVGQLFASIGSDELDIGRLAASILLFLRCGRHIRTGERNRADNGRSDLVTGRPRLLDLEDGLLRRLRGVGDAGDGHAVVDGLAHRALSHPRLETDRRVAGNAGECETEELGRELLAICPTPEHVLEAFLRKEIGVRRGIVDAHETFNEIAEALLPHLFDDAPTLAHLTESTDDAVGSESLLHEVVADVGAASATTGHVLHMTDRALDESRGVLDTFGLQGSAEGIADAVEGLGLRDADEVGLGRPLDRSIPDIPFGEVGDALERHLLDVLEAEDGFDGLGERIARRTRERGDERVASSTDGLDEFSWGLAGDTSGNATDERGKPTAGVLGPVFGEHLSDGDEVRVVHAVTVACHEGIHLFTELAPDDYIPVDGFRAKVERGLHTKLDTCLDRGLDHRAADTLGNGVPCTVERAEPSMRNGRCTTADEGVLGLHEATHNIGLRVADEPLGTVDEPALAIPELEVPDGVVDDRLRDGLEEPVLDRLGAGHLEH